MAYKRRCHQFYNTLFSESSETIYEKLTQLQLIREIEELSSAKPDEYEKVLQKWQQQDVTNFNEFQYIEPILTQRIVMYQINDVLMNNAKVKTELFNTYLEMSKIAADKENLHIATRSLGMQKKMNVYEVYLSYYNISFI